METAGHTIAPEYTNMTSFRSPEGQEACVCKAQVLPIEREEEIMIPLPHRVYPL